MLDRKVGRRKFVKGLSMAGASAVVATSRTRPVLGANDRVVMGIIGSGGMGRNHLNKTKSLNIEWVAVADVYDINLQKGLEIVGTTAKGYSDYRQLLDRKDIDAVLIATPEHWHHDHLLAALKAGKDAYCEKPMSWSIEQGLDMVNAVRKTDRIVQIGMQRRSSPLVREAKSVIDEGMLGEINLVRAEWYWNININRDPTLPGKLDWDAFLGPAPKIPFDAIRFRSWRYFWDYSGGNMTDQGTHLLDVIQWFNNVEQPVAAQTFGAVYKLQPSQTPDTFCAIFEFPKFMCTWTLAYMSTFMKGWGLVFQGQKGTLELSEEGYRVFAEPWSEKGYDRFKTPTPIRQNLAGGATDTLPHWKNFVDCVKSRQQPNATVEIGFRAVRPLHLANIAQHNLQRAELGADGYSVRLS
ncbi:MAG: Gfo/Idh/MocA family oxidoreductase [Terriglobia bacterium]